MLWPNQPLISRPMSAGSHGGGRGNATRGAQPTGRRAGGAEAVRSRGRRADGAAVLRPARRGPAVPGGRQVRLTASRGPAPLRGSRAPTAAESCSCRLCGGGRAARRSSVCEASSAAHPQAASPTEVCKRLRSASSLRSSAGVECNCSCGRQSSGSVLDVHSININALC